MTYKAVNWLDNNVNPYSKIYEWGSGASTLYFLDKGANVISTEHDKIWYEQLFSEINSNLNWKTRARLNYIPPRISKKHDIKFCSTNMHYRNYSFKAYCEDISKYPNSYFDYILIDGRARSACALLALPKTKIGGYIIFDNSHREEYQSAITNLIHNGCKGTVYIGYGPQSHSVTQTTVLKVLRKNQL